MTDGNPRNFIHKPMEYLASKSCAVLATKWRTKSMEYNMQNNANEVWIINGNGDCIVTEFYQRTKRSCKVQLPTHEWGFMTRYALEITCMEKKNLDRVAIDGRLWGATSQHLSNMAQTMSLTWGQHSRLGRPPRVTYRMTLASLAMWENGTDPVRIWRPNLSTLESEGVI